MAVGDLVFDEYYFNGHPGGYTRYSREQYAGFSFLSLAQDLVAKTQVKGLSLAGRKVLVVGCAYGFTVEDLVSLGVDAYGIDISAYAISRVNPAIASRVMVGDVRSASDMDAARTMAGLKRTSKFDLILDEDVLPCLTDADAIVANQNMQSRASRVAHRVSTHAIEGGWYNTHTLAEWIALVDAPPLDWWFRHPRWEEVD